MAQYIVVFDDTTNRLKRTTSQISTSNGDVVGPGSSTDNSVVRFDGLTGKIIQGSSVIIGDTGNVSGVADLTISGAFSGATSISTSGIVSGSNLSGSNTGDLSLGSFGSSPNSNAASLSAQVLTLQPANNLNPGSVSISAQTFGGQKSFQDGGLFPTGSVSAASVGFIGEANTGLFKAGTGLLGVTLAGKASAYIGSDANQSWLQFRGVTASGYATVYTDQTASFLALSGSTASTAGRNALLYGQTHATKASYLEIRRATTVDLTIDGSGSATFAGTVGASNLSGSNTGDQSFVISGEGSASSSTSNLNLTLSNSAVIGKVLTGFVAGGSGPVVATDSILQAIQKLSGSSSGSNSGDVSIGTFSNTASTNGATISSQVLTLTAASATLPGSVSVGAQSFGGDKTFANNVIISGDLTVNGTTTTISTANLNVTDKNITVNNGGSDATATGSGLTVARTSTAGSLIFDATAASKWKAGLVGSEVELVDLSSGQTLTSKTLTSPTINGATLSIDDTSTAFNLSLISTSSPVLTANHNLTFNVQNADRSISMTGNLTVSGNTTVSGNNSGDQTITLTSDVTGSGVGSFATTIASNVVTNAKLAQMGANTLKGNNTGATANAADLSTSQVLTMLGISGSSGSNSGDVTLSNFGSTPSAQGASLSGQVLTLQPASATQPGGLSTTTQSIAGLKNFINGISLRDTSAAFDVQFTCTSNPILTASRTLTIDVDNGNRILALGGDLTVSGAATISGTNSGDQTITLSGAISGTGNGAITTAFASGAFGALNISTTGTLQTGVATIGAVSNTTTSTINGRLTITCPAGTNAAELIVAPTTAETAFTRWSNGTTGFYAGIKSTTGDFVLGTGISNGPGGADVFTLTQAGVASFTGALTASNLSGTNSGNVTLTAVGSTPNANGASLVGQALTLQPASSSFPGIVSTGSQFFAGVKSFSNGLTAGNSSSFPPFTAVAGKVQAYSPNISSSNSTVGGITALGVYAVDGTDNKRAALFADDTNGTVGLSMSATSGVPIFVFHNGYNSTVGAEWNGSTNNWVFTGTASASNLSGSNTGDISLGAVGSAPNANGASLSSQVLTLQPTDGTNPGVINGLAQTIGGVKTFNNQIRFPAGSAASPGISVSTGSEQTGLFRNSGSLGIAVAGVGAASFNGAGSMQMLIAAAGTASISNNVSDGIMALCSDTGTSAGRNAFLYAGTHLTKANYLELRRGTTVDVTINGSGAVTFAGAVTVTGDLTVNGTTTTINTTNLTVTDKNITVNNGGTDATAIGAGISVARTSTAGSFIFDSTAASYWKAGLAGAEIELVNLSSTQSLSAKTISAATNTINGFTNNAVVIASGTGVATSLTGSNGQLLSYSGGVPTFVNNTAISGLTGEVTATGPGSVSATVSNAAVISKTLTGFVSGVGVLSSADSLLSAIQKLDGNVSAIAALATSDQTFAGDGTTVTFSFTAGMTAGDVHFVFINGVFQVEGAGADYTHTAATPAVFTFNAAPALNAGIVIRRLR